MSILQDLAMADQITDEHKGLVRLSKGNVDARSATLRDSEVALCLLTNKTRLAKYLGENSQ